MAPSDSTPLYEGYTAASKLVIMRFSHIQVDQVGYNLCFSSNRYNRMWAKLCAELTKGVGGNNLES